MSYANATMTPAQKMRAGFASLAVPGVVGAGLIASLAITEMITPTVSDPTPADFIEIEIPPPPPPDEVVEDPAPAPDSTVTAPTPPRQLPSDNTIYADPPVLDFPDTPVTQVPDFRVDVPGPAVTPLPSPTPAFDPVGPVPRGNAGNWITNADYPRRGITRELEGTTGYRLVIGSNGRVSGCEITRSSGHSVLDNATCNLLTRNGRFTPARDNRGETVVGTYNGNVTWQLPPR